jgi:hypothetical protein
LRLANSSKRSFGQPGGAVSAGSPPIATTAPNRPLPVILARKPSTCTRVLGPLLIR